MVLHRFFGCHYIMFSYGYGSVICRVRVWPSGVKTVTFYGTTEYLNEKGKTLSSGRSYVTLT